MCRIRIKRIQLSTLDLFDIIVNFIVGLLHLIKYNKVFDTRLIQFIHISYNRAYIIKIVMRRLYFYPSLHLSLYNMNNLSFIFIL